MKYYVDLDGTVADANHRASALTNQDVPSAARWNMFFAPNRMYQDPLLGGAEVLNNLLQGQDHQVTFLTGRPERTREVTDKWLSRHMPGYNPELHTLVMKPDGNFGPTSAWKSERLKDLGEGEDEFVFIDDEPLNRQSVKDGFPSAQVLSPDEGWDHIKGLQQETGASTANEETQPTTPASTPSEDYSEM